MRRALVAIASIAVAIADTACERGRAGDTTTAAQGARTSGAQPSAAAVELSQDQSRAIRVEAVGTYPFFIEREAVGSVSFDEDASVVQAESTLVAAAATLALTRKELERVQGLGEANGIAQKELEQAIADQQTAAGALTAARNALRVLGKTDAQTERIIATGKPDLTAARAGTKWVVANVSEIDSPLVRSGQAVAVKVMAYPARLYVGKVSRIYAAIDPDTHRITTRAVVSDPGDELRPGMLADVTIRIGGPVESVAVPTTAVVRKADGTMTAWVTADRRRFVQRPLKLGQQGDGRYQVLDGLRRGELVAIEGGVFLSNMLEAPPSD
jgi:membrane fusion protein, heavy metal efflux system